MADEEALALAIGAVIALTADLDGNDAAQKAANSKTALLEAAKRVIAAETLAAVHASKDAVLADNSVPPRKVEDAALSACVHADNVRTIAVLDPKLFATNVAEADRAEASATDAFAGAQLRLN